jgi:hypothetical protein
MIGGGISDSLFAFDTTLPLTFHIYVQNSGFYKITI